MSNDATADDILDKVTINLLNHGLHVNIPIDVPFSPYDPEADCILVRNPVSGQCAKVGYVVSVDDSGDVFLELTYRTASDKDPDGMHMADGVVRLLSPGSPVPSR